MHHVCQVQFFFLILNEFAPIVHNLGKLALYYIDAPKGPFQPI